MVVEGCWSGFVLQPRDLNTLQTSLFQSVLKGRCEAICLTAKGRLKLGHVTRVSTCHCFLPLKMIGGHSVSLKSTWRQCILLLIQIKLNWMDMSVIPKTAANGEQIIWKKRMKVLGMDTGVKTTLALLLHVTEGNFQTKMVWIEAAKWPLIVVQRAIYVPYIGTNCYFKLISHLKQHNWSFKTYFSNSSTHNKTNRTSANPC